MQAVGFVKQGARVWVFVNDKWAVCTVSSRYVKSGEKNDRWRLTSGLIADLHPAKRGNGDKATWCFEDEWSETAGSTIRKGKKRARQEPNIADHGIKAGTAIRKLFKGYGWFDGVVLSATPSKISCKWDGGTTTTLTPGEAEKCILQSANNSKQTGKKEKPKSREQLERERKARQELKDDTKKKQREETRAKAVEAREFAAAQKASMQEKQKAAEDRVKAQKLRDVKREVLRAQAEAIAQERAKSIGRKSKLQLLARFDPAAEEEIQRLRKAQFKRDEQQEKERRQTEREARTTQEAEAAEAERQKRSKKIIDNKLEREKKLRSERSRHERREQATVKEAMKQQVSHTRKAYFDQSASNNSWSRPYDFFAHDL